MILYAADGSDVCVLGFTSCSDDDDDIGDNPDTPSKEIPLTRMTNLVLNSYTTGTRSLLYDDNTDETECSK